MGLWVWMRRDGDAQRRVLRKTERGNEGVSLPIVISDYDDARSLPQNRQVFEERSYYVPLEYILQDSLKASEQRLVTFVRTAVSHLRQEVAGLRHGA